MGPLVRRMHAGGSLTASAENMLRDVRKRAITFPLSTEMVT